MTTDDVWNFIQEHRSNGNIVTASSNAGVGADPWGIIMGQSYTVTGGVTLSDGTKLVRVRCPWSKDTYVGEFGAKSPKWTEALVKEIPDALNQDDGYQYLPLE